MKVVVDTNVPIVANGKSEQASPACVLACVKRLEELKKSDKLVLDDQWRILGEYLRNLNPTGQPGYGDAFIRWIFDNKNNPKYFTWITITPTPEDDSNFKEFPDSPGLHDFDPSDRKFVAVSAADPDHPPILQAVDSKWWKWKDVLKKCGISVIYLCQDDIAEKYKKKTKNKTNG